MPTDSEHWGLYTGPDINKKIGTLWLCNKYRIKLFAANTNNENITQWIFIVLTLIVLTVLKKWRTYLID